VGGASPHADLRGPHSLRRKRRNLFVVYPPAPGWKSRELVPRGMLHNNTNGGRHQSLRWRKSTAWFQKNKPSRSGASAMFSFSSITLASRGLGIVYTPNPARRARAWGRSATFTPNNFIGGAGDGFPDFGEPLPAFGLPCWRRPSRTRNAAANGPA